MKRRKQRITAIVCFYIYFFSKRDIETIYHDFIQAFIIDRFDDTFLQVDEATLAMMKEAVAYEAIVIHKINSLLKEGWQFNRLNLVVQAILFMAVSELVYEVDEKSIIINEAVEISKIYGDEDDYKLVNGVLDNL